MITPNEYVELRSKVHHLISAYKSVNDKNVVNVIKSECETFAKELGIIETREWEQVWQIVGHNTCSHSMADKVLVKLEKLVLAFKVPTPVQLSKLFQKVKKLPDFDFDNWDLFQTTYIGFNDTGDAKKFLIIPNETGKLKGIVDEFDPEVTNGLCAICQTIGNVSMFSVKVKQRGANGNYTKRGNYICTDSHACNKQLTELSAMHNFLDTMTKA